VIAMQDYCQGALEQVLGCLTGHSRNPEDLSTIRRSSIDPLPLYALFELGHQLDILKQSIRAQINSVNQGPGCGFDPDPERHSVIPERRGEFQGAGTDGHPGRQLHD